MPSAYTSTISPYDVTVVISKGDNFTHIVSGYLEDSIVTVTQNMPRYELYTGADNTNTRIHKNNTSATITFHLTHSSNSNDILSELHRQDAASRNSSGMFSLLVADNSGRTRFHALEAFIAVFPDAAISNTMQPREWVIQAVKCDSYVGGNAPFDPADAAAMEALGVTIEDRWR